MHSIAGLASGIGSTTLPCFSIYSPSGNGLVIRELACWNTTAVGCTYKWQRLTTTGTQGTGLTTEMEWDESGVAPTATAFDAHSVAPTLGIAFEYMPIGAAIGAGYYYTYGASGIVVAPGTGNGVGLILAVGTGQVLAYRVVWEEN
jgi:hypothetical protein